MKKVAIIASASGNGKTTLGRQLASRLDVPFVELDALVHGPDWQETSDAELRAQVEPIVSSDGWVIDGAYERKLGDLVLAGADTIVWLDLPIRIWLPRLARRSYRRISRNEGLWNDNRETLRGVLWGKDSLIGYALRMHFRRRREYPTALSQYTVVHLRTDAEVESFRSDLVPSADSVPYSPSA